MVVFIPLRLPLRIISNTGASLQRRLTEGHAQLSGQPPSFENMIKCNKSMSTLVARGREISIRVGHIQGEDIREKYDANRSGGSSIAVTTLEQ